MNQKIVSTRPLFLMVSLMTPTFAHACESHLIGIPNPIQRVHTTVRILQTSFIIAHAVHHISRHHPCDFPQSDDKGRSASAIVFAGPSKVGFTATPTSTTATAADESTGCDDGFTVTGTTAATTATTATDINDFRHASEPTSQEQRQRRNPTRHTPRSNNKHRTHST